MYRRFRYPSIWHEMQSLQRDMNRLFNRYGDSSIRSAPHYPAINLWSKGDDQFVSAEMPGVRAEDVQVSVEGNTLMISGERKAQEMPEGARMVRKERNFGSFSRTLQLPYRVDPEKVDASFHQGILSIQLPRAEEDKPKKIAIRS